MDNAQYFNQVAASWSDMRQAFFSEKVRDVAYSYAHIEQGDSAADIGAGTGFMTEGLLARGVSVSAVDHSEGMIQQLQHRFRSDVRFSAHTGESEALPLMDDSVDCAFANMFLHHVESPADSIKEMARIVKPGGKIVITDLDEHGFTFLATEHCDRWMGFHREAIRKWFMNAGLTNISVDCVGDTCTATSQDTGDNATVSIFVAYGEKRKGEKTK